MLNMLDTQDKLKNFSEAQLIKEMQMPSGSAPQFMVLSEIERRKRMRSDVQRQEGLMQPTVAQDAVSAAGVPQQGIAQVAQSLAPKTDMTQNTGVPNVQAAGLPAQPNQPQRMADGGIMRLAPGGFVSGGDMSAIARLKVSNPALYEQYKDNPEELARIAASLSSSMLTQLGESESQGSGGYNAQNNEGFVGKYQFGDARLTDFRDATGQDFTMEQFKANPALQEEVVQWHQKDISDYANDTGLDAYKGQTINGVLINDDSIMAMAHLGGKSGMRQFIESGGEYNPADSNGTTLRDYGMKFGGSSDDEVAQAIMAQMPNQPDYSPGAIKTTELDKFYPTADPNFVPKAYLGQQVQGGMGLGQILDPNATSIYGGYGRDPENPGLGERIVKGLGPFIDSASKGFPRNEGESAFSGFMRDPDNPSGLDQYFIDVEENARKKRDQNIDNIGRFNAAESQGNAMGAAAEVFTPPNPYEIKMQKKKDDAERAKRIADEDEAMSKVGIASVKKTPVEKPDDKSFKSTASKLGQSEWLALAQAGLTLMSDPNLANAGKAGLSAYKDLKAIDLATAKAGMRKPVTGAYLTDMRKQLEALVAERSMLREPEKSSIFGFGGKMVDPDRVARERINDRIAELEQAIRQAYRSANINVNPTGSKNAAYDLRDKVQT
tara:strand:+ start:11 stop:2002 length:1992 start_codon:yes stop_codon:yes gene_type:complete